jgi:predicted Zn-dependent peptidase
MNWKLVLASVAVATRVGAAELPPSSTPPSEAPAAATAGPAAAPAIGLPYEKYVLGNGLEVILHEDHRQPTVTVNVWYHVGAFAEEPGKTGFAHLFEHLMFQGSAHVDGDKHFKLLEEAGSAIINGTTDFDRTNYFETVPKNELELALWLEADRMAWLMPTMTQAKLDEQRGVVKNERRQTTEGVPYGLAEEKLWQAVFPVEHPYHGSVIGSMVDLDHASLDDVRRFYDDHYAPSNATLCIAGDITPADAKKLVDKYFRSLPSWPKPKARSVPAPSIASEIRVDHVETVGAVPLVEVLWLTPARGQPDQRELDVLARVLGDGIASKLQDALLVQSELAQEVTVAQQSMANVSAFTIRVVVRPGVTADDVLNTIQAQLDYLRDVPVSPEEVTRALNRIETERTFALQMGFVRADVLQDGNHFDGDPGAFVSELAKYRAITADAVMAAMKKHLTKEHRAILVALPAGGPAASTTPADAAAAPKEAP